MKSSAAKKLAYLEDLHRDRYKHVERTPEEMHDYQWLAVKFLLENPYAALFIDTGLGKTVIVLTLIQKLLLEDMTHRILVVAPVRVAAQGWPNEIAAWEHTAWMSYSVIRAEDDEESVRKAGRVAMEAARKQVERQAAGLEELGLGRAEAKEWAGKRLASIRGKGETAKKDELRRERAASPAPVHMINREALRWLIDLYSEWVPVKRSGKVRKVRKIVGWPYDVVILDESSSFKDHTTGRFKAISAVRQQLRPLKKGAWIKRLIELTATPAAEGYLGVFAQVFLLDAGERLGRFITHYQRDYFDYNRYSRKFTLRPGADEKISEKIADICLVMKSGDYLDEVEPLFLKRPISLSPAELRQYREFEETNVLTLEDGEEIVADSAAALSQKLLQYASGAVYTEDRQTRIVHRHKLDDLAELYESLQVSGEPLVVAYWFKPSLARLKKEFPFAKVVDPAGKIVSRHGPWNSGKVPMLLVHPASVGHGINMQYGPGHDLYMYDSCWSYELYYQLYRRLHRQGQKKQVRVHLPLTRETPDEIVVARLGEKEDAQEALFNYIMRRRRQALARAAAREMARAA